jgi:hypothetical protein
MIRAQGLDLEFWAKAVNTAVYIKNQCPTKALDSKTPQDVENNIIRGEIAHSKTRDHTSM